MKNIYIYMDDSGKLTPNEQYLVYGGIVFQSKQEKDIFSRKYKAIIKAIQCKYCTEIPNSCSNNCSEVKSCFISTDDRRRIINLCKQYKIFSVFVQNNLLRDYVFETKASKGRYTDYAIKMLVKSIVKRLISENIINQHEDISLNIYLDQQTTKSNGYYDLRGSIYEELIHGITNFNYGFVTKPVLHGKLNLIVQYLNSQQSTFIQSADIIAGTVRKTIIHTSDLTIQNEKLNGLLWLYQKLP